MILRSYNWSGSYRKLQKQPFFKKMVNSHFAVVLGNSCILKNAFEETCHNFLILQVFACTISSTRNIPHSLLHLAAAAAAKSLQSCPTLCDPIDGSPPGSPIPGILQAQNTGVGCHFLLQCMKVKSESEVAQSYLTLRNPMDCSPPGSSAHGVFQARVLEWGAIAFSVFTWLILNIKTNVVKAFLYHQLYTKCLTFMITFNPHMCMFVASFSLLNCELPEGRKDSLHS